MPEALAAAVAAAAHLRPGDAALDVGGGRGDHAAEWGRSGVHAVVLDPALLMLEQAAARPGVRAVAGRAEAIPFRSGVFRLVYFHLSIHYGQLERTLGEARRVLADDGRIEIWTLGPRHHGSSNLARWFPRVAAIDAERFPDPEVIVAELGRRGLDVQRHARVQPVQRRAGDWVRSVRAGFVSTLQLLSGDEIEDGLDAFRRAHPDPDEIVHYTLDYDQIVAAPRPLP